MAMDGPSPSPPRETDREEQHEQCVIVATPNHPEQLTDHGVDVEEEAALTQARPRRGLVPSLPLSSLAGSEPASPVLLACPAPPSAAPTTLSHDEDELLMLNGWPSAREEALQAVYRAFDLDCNGDVGEEELLELGKARRALGQKQGEWTPAMNARVLMEIGADNAGHVSMEARHVYVERAVTMEYYINYLC